MNEKIKKFYNASKIKITPNESSDPLSWPEVWKKIFYKTYLRFLSKDLNISEQNGELEKLLIKRRTTRDFSQEKISFETLSNLLFYSAGISTDRVDLDKVKRTYPSAGARYPIELYLLSHSIEDIEKGLYHYNVRDNNLELMLKKDLSKFTQKIMHLNSIPAAIIVLTSVISRSEIKYNVNSYRFSLLEAGHIGQNISLLCEKYNMGCCAIGGFDNNRISRLLDLTEEEIPLYLFAIGKKS